MGSVQLLDKTRKIGKLLHNNNSGKVVFNDICDVLKEILVSNVLVVSRKEKSWESGDMPTVESITELIVDHVGGFIDPMLNERLLGCFPPRRMSIWKHSGLRARASAGFRR